MDLAHIGTILSDLRLANEVEAAAELDVADAEANVAFYTRKLEITKDRLAETKVATQDVCDRLAEAITEATYSPLLLAHKAESRNAAR